MSEIPYMRNKVYSYINQLEAINAIGRVWEDNVISEAQARVIIKYLKELREVKLDTINQMMVLNRNETSYREGYKDGVKAAGQSEEVDKLCD